MISMYDKLGLHSNLILGNNIELGDFTVYNYSLEDIFNNEIVGVGAYNKYFGLFKIPYLDEGHKSLYEAITSYSNTLRDFEIMLGIYTRLEWRYVPDLNEFVSGIGNDKLLVFNEETFKSFYDILVEMYCIPANDDINEVKIPKKIRDLLKEFDEFDEKIGAKKNGLTLNSLALSISSRHPSYNLFNIGKLKVYQLIHTYSEMIKGDEFDMFRMVSANGMLSEDVKIDSKKIHWSYNSNGI